MITTVTTDERAISVPGGVVRSHRRRGALGGSRAPLLVLHGGPGGSCTGFAALEALATDRDVVFFDQLGSATSERTDSATNGVELWTIERFCAEVDAVRTAWGLDEVVLFGHSWGGWLSIDYLCRGASGVTGAVLADTTAGFPAFAASIDRRVTELSESSRDAVAAVRAGASIDTDEYRGAAIEFYSSFVVRQVPGREVAGAGVAGAGVAADDVAAEVLDRQRSTAVFQYMQGADELHADGALATWDRAADLGSITIPTLVVHGRHDHMDRFCADELVAGIPRSRLAVFEASSHCPHLEEPDALIATVAGWLVEIEQS